MAERARRRGDRREEISRAAPRRLAKKLGPARRHAPSRWWLRLAELAGAMGGEPGICSLEAWTGRVAWSRGLAKSILNVPKGLHICAQAQKTAVHGARFRYRATAIAAPLARL